MGRPRWRVIVDNDFAGDPDGLVSLAHVLLTGDVAVELITCTPVSPDLARLVGVDPTSTAASAARQARVLLDVLEREEPRIVAGAESFGVGEPGAGEASAAARAIVSACLAESDVPLAILCGGPLTNIAAAIALEPGICDRAVLAWIGGSIDAEDGGVPEYNRDMDAAAAAVVLSSPIPVVQVPLEAYRQLRVSIAEVRHDLAGASPVGAWLADRLLDLPPFVTLHGALTLGDSALAALVALDETFALDAAADVPSRRMLTAVDTRLVWGDLLAKLRLHGLEVTA